MGGGGDLPPLPDASYGPGFQSMLAVHAFFFIRTNFIRTPRLRFAQKLRTS